MAVVRVFVLKYVRHHANGSSHLLSADMLLVVKSHLQTIVPEG
jgi:hypothetical protein